MKLISLITLLLIQISVFSQNFTVSGYVKDSTSGEELIGAAISVKEKNSGIATNYYGYYVLTLPQGTYTLSYSYIGYQTYTKKINVNKNIRLDVDLVSDAATLEEVIVGAEALDKNIKSAEMSVQKLSIKEVRSIPVVFGENDVMKTLTLLPGVKSGGEASGGIYVRGGGSDQNLILIDEAPVYNASHLGGLFSVFNSDAISDVKLYKGGMPAEYGGRLSAVLDLKMKEGNSKKYSVSGGIGLISSRIAVEGPVVKNKGSFIVAARRSYADIFLGLAKDTLLEDVKLYFYDLNIKGNYKINDKNRIFISGYFGKDVLQYQKLFGMDWSNTTGTLRWNHLFSEKLFLNTSLIFSKYDYEMNAEFMGTSLNLQTGIDDINLKSDFSYFLNDKNTIKFGIQGIHHTFSPGAYTIENDGFNLKVNAPQRYGIESAIYLQNDQKLTKSISVNYGVRLSDFAAKNKEEYSKNYFGFEPRISANLKLNDVSSVKASASKTNQYINLIQISSLSSPIDYWIPVGEKIKPQICYQYGIGYFRNFAENKYETSIEIYYKNMENQIDFKNGGNTFNYENIEDELIFGKGRSYGVELYGKKVLGKLTGWISYSFSKTERSFEDVYDGTWYPYRQDRTHDVSITTMYQITKKIGASVSWIYYNGDMVTMPTGKYQIEGFDVASYSGRNNFQYPDYHRLDVGLNIDLKTRWAKESSLNISVYNVYNRKNTFMIMLEDVYDSDGNETGEKQAYSYSLYPILPSITWNFKF